MSNNNGFQLLEEYPLVREVETPRTLSDGLRRHMPIGYDQLGRYREKPATVPWGLAVAIVLAGGLFARAVL